MTLEQLLGHPSARPTMLEPAIEARIIRAMMAEFEATERPEDETIQRFTGKLMDSRTANVSSGSRDYLDACGELRSWKERNVAALKARWPNFLDAIESYY